jgi:hypothetical protein
MNIRQPSTVLIALTAALLAGPSWAVAVPEVGYGTHVGVVTAGNCPSFCTGNQFAFAEDGTAGATAAAASESTYATGRGSAELSPAGGYLPVLKAYGSAALGKATGVSSFASQMFTYLGDAATIELTVNLSGTTGDNGGGYSFNNINADVAIVRGDTLPWYPSFATLIYEIVPSEDRLALGGLDIGGPLSTTLTFELVPGDSFFVVSQLNVNSNNGFADAEHTLRMAFDANSAADMVAATAPVPEPATAWMAALGLLALGWRARRRAAPAS